MMGAISLILPGVNAGIRSLSVLIFLPHYLSFSLLYSSWGKSSAGLKSLGEQRVISLIVLLCRASALSRLVKSRLCFHSRQCPRVSLLKLIKLIKAGSQSVQSFSTPVLFQFVYRVIKIVHIIGQSVMLPKTGSINHWLQFANFGCNHAS